MHLTTYVAMRLFYASTTKSIKRDLDLSMSLRVGLQGLSQVLGGLKDQKPLAPLYSLSNQRQVNYPRCPLFLHELRPQGIAMPVYGHVI